MTDRELSEALLHVKQLEARVEAVMASGDTTERESAVLVRRLTIPLRQKLEAWASARIMRREISVNHGKIAV